MTVILSAAATLYCLPPVLMTANIVFSVFNPALRVETRGRLLGSWSLLVFAPPRRPRAEKQKRGRKPRERRVL
jgi:hypothetical protein